jgi:hypothetical protein
MLFMVIEQLTKGIEPVAERFRRQGRMLPGGVTYNASWLDYEGTRCYQLMDAPSRERLSEWTSRWDDLLEFEVIPVLTSADFWARRNSGSASPKGASGC